MISKKLFFYVIIICVSFTTFIFAAYVGPYNGFVLDAENNMPLEGVSVVFAITKTVPKFFEGYDTVLAAVSHVYTNEKGRYHIPGEYIFTFLSHLDSICVIIYQPGYQAVVASRSFIDDPKKDLPLPFETKNIVVKLDKISLFIDHNAHLKQIHEALEYYEIPASIKTDIENRYDWEKKRSERSSDKYRKQKKIVRQVDEELKRQLSSKDAMVRRLAVKNLAHCTDKQALQFLIESLQDEEPWVRYEAVCSLGEINNADAVLPLLTLIKQNNPWPHTIIQQEALIAINKIVSPTLLVFNNYQSPPYEPDSRNLVLINGAPSKQVLRGLETEVLPVLSSTLKDVYLKKESINLAEHFYSFPLMSIIEESIFDSEPEIRKSALTTCLRLSLMQQQVLDKSQEKEGKKNTEKIFQLLVKSLDDPDADVRSNSISILSRLGDTRAIEPLIKTLAIDGHREMTMNALDRFNDIKILYGLIDYFGIDNKAADHFLSMALKTCPQYVYICHKGGTKYVSFNSPFQENKYVNSKIVWGKVTYFRRMFYPEAVEILINKYQKCYNAKKDILRIIDEFEDERIKTSIVDPLKRFGEIGQEQTVFVQQIEVESPEELFAGKNIIPEIDPRKLDTPTSGISAAGNTDKLPKIQHSTAKFSSQDGGRKAGGLVVFRGPSNPNRLSKFYKDTILRSISPSDTLNLLDDLKNADPEIRHKAENYLAENGDRFLLEPLLKLLTNDNAYIRDSAYKVLDKLRKHITISYFLYDEALPLAESGNIQSQILIGSILSDKKVNKGYGVKYNYEEAVKWFHKAGESGYAPAFFLIGNLYTLRGKKEEAFKSYLTAATQGHAPSQVKIASYYLYGTGMIPKDYKKAFEWYLKAAENGDTDSACIIGNCYYYGRGVDKDHAAALDWYLKFINDISKTSRRHISIAAYLNVAEIYRDGKVVPRNLDKALDFYQKAEASGSVRAKNSLLQLLKERNNSGKL